MCHVRMIKFSERVQIESTSNDSKNRKVRLVLKILAKHIDFNPDMLQYVGMLDCSAELEKIDYGVFSQHRSTIVNLTFSDKKRNKIRRIVMDEQDPSFGLNNQVEKYKEFYHSYIQGCKSFNEDQRSAIEKALSMDMFSLIEGMPGTGKTKVIVGLIEIFSALGVKVLVSSYTNNSLECILGRVLEKANIDPAKIIR